MVSELLTCLSFLRSLNQWCLLFSAVIVFECLLQPKDFRGLMAGLLRDNSFRCVPGASGLFRRLALVALLVPSVASADIIPPESVQISTPVYKPEPGTFSQRLGTYTYSVGWQGIPAAEVKVRVGKHDGRYVVTTNVRTLTAIDLLYKLRFESNATFRDHTFKPELFSLEQRENSKVKNVKLHFQQDGEIRAERSMNKGDEKVIQFNPHNFTLDPFTAGFLARSLDWKIGETRQFDVFNGKSRYLINLTAEEKTKIKLNGTERSVVAVVPSVKNLTDTAANNKLKKAKIYVSDDRHHDVLRIVSSVFIGSVTTELEEFEATS